MYRRIHVVALFAATALAACSTDTVVAPEKALAVRSHFSHIVGSGLAPHTIAPAHFQTPIDLSRNAGAPVQDAAVAAAGPLPIQYWGGGVIDKQRITLIYYSPTTIFKNGPQPGTVGNGETDHSLVGDYMNNLGKTPYWNINSTYYDALSPNNKPSFINNWMQYKSYWAANAGAPSPGGYVSEDDMVYLIESGFANGSLNYDPNTLYMIVTGPGVNLGGGFSPSSLSYCAFHSGYWFEDGSPIVQFGAMPYDADFNPDHPSKKRFICTYLTKGPNGDLGADATVSALTHETEETATDPVSLQVPPYFAGWYDVQGEENGDKCAYIYGSTLTRNSLDYWNLTIGGKPFLVQQNWSNLTQSCLTGLDGTGPGSKNIGGGVKQ
jgi:hypothetical protein